MIGRRVPINGRSDYDVQSALQPGDYAGPILGRWHLRSPDDEKGAVNSTVWTIVEHDDGTITVSPSIWFSHDGERCTGWHGFLEKGVWRKV